MDLAEHQGYLGVVALLEEWLGHWRDCLRERGLSAVEERALALCRATEGWTEIAPLSVLENLWADLQVAQEAGPSERLEQTAADYRAELQRQHDMRSWLLWALPSAVGDEALGLEINFEALERCPGYAGLWQAAAALPPEALAALAADHLRAHLSEVRVVEEPDRIRVVLDLCGSGGAMRRGAPGRTPGYARLEQPSELSWGRAGEVPSYCAHCAYNEQVSLRKLGRKAWTTEFNPDPHVPCGWTFPR